MRVAPVTDNTPADGHHGEAKPIPENIIKPWTRPAPNSYVFQSINVVDLSSGTILPNRDVHIADGKILSITDVASSSNPFIPNRTIRIPSHGKYLTPGLIDAHVHLTSVPSGSPTLSSSFNIPTAVSLFRQPGHAAAMLSRGYTTARDCGGASLALKQSIDDGIVSGPRLFIAGQALSQTGGHGDRRGAFDDECPSCGSSTATLSQVVDGAPAVLAAARNQLRQGADFLKLMVGGGVASPADKLESVQFTAEEIRAAVEVAEGAGTYVTAHAYTPRAIRRAVENGVRGIEHGNFLDEETAKFMAEKGVWLTPTLVTYWAMADKKYAAFLPRENREKNEAVLREGLRSLKVAYEAGVRLCLGSDLLSFLGVEQAGEFGLRARVLPAVEVLRQATVNPAQMMGAGDKLGLVEESFIADLLVLNENPLEDVTVFERPQQHLLAVVKEGRVYCSRWSKMPVDVNTRVELID